MVDEVFAIYKPKLRFEGVLSTTTCPLSVRSSETHRNVVKDLFATSTRISRHSSRLVLLELQQASVRPFFLSLSISLSLFSGNTIVVFSIPFQKLGHHVN